MAVAERIAVFPLVYGRSMAFVKPVGARAGGSSKQVLGELRGPHGRSASPRFAVKRVADARSAADHPHRSAVYQAPSISSATRRVRGQTRSRVSSAAAAPMYADQAAPASWCRACRTAQAFLPEQSRRRDHGQASPPSGPRSLSRCDECLIRLPRLGVAGARRGSRSETNGAIDPAYR